MTSSAEGLLCGSRAPAGRRRRYPPLAALAGDEARGLSVLAAAAGHQMRERTQPMHNRWLLVQRGSALCRAALTGSQRRRGRRLTDVQHASRTTLSVIALRAFSHRPHVASGSFKWWLLPTARASCQSRPPTVAVGHLTRTTPQRNPASRRCAKGQAIAVECERPVRTPAPCCAVAGRLRSPRVRGAAVLDVPLRL